MNAYHDLIRRLAEQAPDATHIRNLPELTLEDLAAALTSYPSVFIDAVADFSPALDNCAALTLARTEHSNLSRYGQLGCLLVGALRTYLLPIVLRDVQAQCERNRELDAVEDLGSHFPKTDEAMALMLDLGVARMFRS